MAIFNDHVSILRDSEEEGRDRMKIYQLGDSLETWDEYQRDAMRYAELSIGKGKAAHLDELSFRRFVSSHGHVHRNK